MKKLYTPADESDLVFIKSLFEAEGIPFYIQNEHFGSLYSGFFINDVNAKSIMVPDEYFDEAKGIIEDIKSR